MLNLLKIIESYGYEAYYIGGYPRDLYMGLKTNDYDVVTSAKPIELEKFLDLDMKYANLGSVTTIYNNKKVDLTTMRKEGIYLNNRRPESVEYINSLEEDLKRRDFIINTLCLNSNGEFIDLMGAKKDIDNKIIRTAINSDISLEKDAIRILRAIRFKVKLNFKLDKELEKSIIKYKDNLKTINKNRVNKEIDIILSYPNGKEELKKYNII